MCGIIGYIGNNNASPILFKSLKRMEYRGYDSAGIATINNNELILKKDIGRIDQINEKIKSKAFKPNEIIKSELVKKFYLGKSFKF